MASINKQIAMDLVKSDGNYPGDPQAYAVFKYDNTHFNVVSYGVAYNAADLERYTSDFRVEYLWRCPTLVIKMLNKGGK